MANLQQPNAQNVSGAIQNIADVYQDLVTEVTRIQSMPESDRKAQIIRMIQQLANGQEELRDQVGELQNQQQRLPMMLYNTSASNHAPLRYPAGVPINNLPATRDELKTFTGPQLQVAAEALGLPALPHNALAGQRRVQIAEHLGTSV